MHLSYEATAGGCVDDATNYLTGGTTSAVDIQAETINQNWDDLFQVMKPLSGQDADLIFCSANTRSTADPEILQSVGLISGHAYSILQMKVSKTNGLHYIREILDGLRGLRDVV